jgi:hypothetical protein
LTIQTDGLKNLDKVVEPIEENNRNYKGFNFFSKEDEKKSLFLLLTGNLR